MTRTLEARTIRSRFRDYGMTAHTQVTSLMFSGVFALAALTLVDILRAPDGRLVRISFWLVAVAAEVSSLNRQLQRPMLMGRSSMQDVPLLALRGLLAMIAFAFLTPQYGGAEGWRYVCFVLILLVAVGWLLAGRFLAIVTENAVPEGLQLSANNVLKHQRQEFRVFPVMGAVYLFIGAAALLANGRPGIIEALVIVFNLACLVGVLAGLLLNLKDWQAFEQLVDREAAAEDERLAINHDAPRESGNSQEKTAGEVVAALESAQEPRN